MKKSKAAILVVSFGTSYNNTRNATIGAIESTIAEFFPTFEVRRAFTSGIVIGKLFRRDGIIIDSVDLALTKLADEGYRRIYIQPTHIIEGDEFDLIAKIAEDHKDRFDSIKIGQALLKTPEDIDMLIDILCDITAQYNDKDTARVFMGHGTEHAANEMYVKLQKRIAERGINNIFIGTVEPKPSINKIAETVKSAGFKKALLSPLMIVAGEHVINDMAGDGEDSWKSILEKEGLEVTCRLVGLGREYAIQQMIAGHCRVMLKRD